MILDEIIASTRIRVEYSKKELSAAALLKQLNGSTYKESGFKEALQSYDGIAIIGEIKKASPSKGLIRNSFSHTDIAKEYIASDIQAISILTEPLYFKGNLQFIGDIKEMTDIPLLRKDFIVDEYQIYEAKLYGADAILLIMAALSNAQFQTFFQTAQRLGLDCLVETHNREEVLRAAEYAEIIGVNNRSLQTFEEDITTVERLLGDIPKDTLVVAESAIRSHDDFVYLENLGIDAALIGEAFMREESVAGAVRKLRCGV